MFVIEAGAKCGAQFDFEPDRFLSATTVQRIVYHPDALVSVTDDSVMFDDRAFGGSLMFSVFSLKDVRIANA
jgi:hypothetical protein